MVATPPNILRIASRQINAGRSVDANPFYNSAIASNVRAMNRGGARLDTLFRRYYSEPKNFGAGRKAILGATALCSLDMGRFRYAKSWVRAETLALSASAIREAAFVDTISAEDPLENVDERLSKIETSGRLLTHAQAHVDPADVYHHRLRLHGGFTRVMQDIACGEVTVDTSAEVLDMLDEALESAGDINSYSERRGLIGELLTLQYYWGSYFTQGNIVAIPASVRGDNGTYNPSQTHDIARLVQAPDETWEVLPPVEVKRFIRDEDRSRYTESLLAHVANDGTVSISDDHCR